jgi:tetratricopeptide (TPR) repeat protein
MNPKLEYIHNNIGLAYEHNGFKDKAIEHYKLSIRKEPYQSDSYYNLGRLNYENRNYKTAIRYLKEAYHLNPNFGDITHILGLCYLKIDEKETACNYFQISIDAGCESALNSQKEYCSEQVSE